MSNSSEKIKFTVLCSADIFLLAVTHMLFKMTTSVESNKTLFFIAAVPCAVSVIFTAVNVLKRYINDNLIMPNIPVLIITLLVAIGLCKYLTAFSFERWQEKENLRPFIAMELIDVQNNRKKYGDSEYRLNKYTEAERKELLSVNERKDRNPKITVNFSDESLSAEIYYAYNGFDLKDYWLVLIIRENDTVERAEIYPSDAVVNL